MFDRILCAVGAPAATFTLLACIPVAGSTAPVTTSQAQGAAATTGVPVANSGEIAGAWDIVSFGGYRPTRLQGTTRTAIADFTDDGVSLRIGCNGSGVTGKMRDGRFISRPGERIQTLMGCGPEREARDRALFGFFDRKPRVERITHDRLRLVAGADVLELERPAIRRLAYLPRPDQLLGEWRLLELARYDAQGGMTGIGLSDVPGRIVFDGIRVHYTPCPQYGVRYRFTDRGQIRNLGARQMPISADGCTALRNPMPGYDIPEPGDVLRLLHASPDVEIVDPQTILISNARFGLLLTTRPPDAD